MNNIISKYRFFTTIDGDQVEIRPCNSELKWKDAPHDDECFWRKSLETELIIDDKDLFNQLWNMQKNGCNCNILPIQITNRCCSDFFDEYWNGKLAFVDGSWDLDNCKLSITPRINDIWSKYLIEAEKEKNYLEITDRVDILTLLGEVVCQTTPQVTINDGDPIPEPIPPDGYGWTLTQMEVITVNEETPGGIETTTVSYQYTFCRQCLETNPNIDGWQFEDGQWYAPIVTGSSTYTTSFSVDTDPDGAYTVTTIELTVYEIIDFSSDNGITIQNFIEFYIGDCFDQDICSNFFNINPDGTNPPTIEYQYAETNLQNLIFFSSFEIVAENGDAIISGDPEQTAGIKKWIDLWDDIKNMFGVCMWHDRTNDCIRIEHHAYISALTESAGKVLNLTDNPMIKGKGKFTYSKNDIPLRERWKYDFESNTEDWDNARIEYEPDCSDDNPSTNEKKKTIECFINDVLSIYHNVDLIEDRDVINSITLIAATPANLITSLDGDISGESILNGALATSNLVRYLHLRDRPACVALVNGVEMPLLSKKKLRQQEEIDLILDCSIYNALDPQIDQVQTQFGNTLIESVTYTDPIGEIKLNLKF